MADDTQKISVKKNPNGSYKKPNYTPPGNRQLVKPSGEPQENAAVYGKVTCELFGINGNLEELDDKK